MSTKTSTAALESLGQRLLLLQRRIPRHPAGGFLWGRRIVEMQGGPQGDTTGKVGRNAPGTASETVSRTLRAKRLNRIKEILKRAGFTVEIVNAKASADRV